MSAPTLTAAEGIPDIDISPFATGDAAAQASVAADVDLACREIGFFTIRGHGIGQPQIDAALAMADAFFGLPETEKLTIRQPAPQISRGYTPLAAEQLSAGLGEAAPPDLKELIDIGPIEIGTDPYYTGPDAGDHFHANLWPAAPEGFRDMMEGYYRAMNGLADTLMEIFAVALGQPSGFFANALDRNISALRLICYPEQLTPPVPGQLRGGAHTDYGTLTILTADQAPGGLQAQRHDGVWIDVVPQPGTFIVNIGDAMQVWTNDQWISTLHRVVNPPAALAATARRISMPFFHQPNYDAVIAPLPGCVPEGAVPHHAPITFGEHWMRKWAASRDID
ncbi:MAG: 2-oxoglutarate and iron-dependent oxygenase domain-containing protein [Pseudomonadota bacterium]